MTDNIYNFDTTARYKLLAQASYSKAENVEHIHSLIELKKLIESDLTKLALEGCPPNFPEILKMFQLELKRFETFCSFPYLAQKNVIGIGGAFSAGKSSFLNTLLGSKKLVVEVDPTTSVPTYLMSGDSESITGLNLFDRTINLSTEDFLSFTHEEYEHFGSEVAGLLKSVFIQDTEFKWDNLALLDTPGYSNTETQFNSDRTDAKVAFSQLNTAHFIIWIISAVNGTISEDDLDFLSRIDPTIPKLIVLSRSDLKPREDLEAIQQLILELTAKRGIEILDVILSSARKRKEFPLDQIETYLNQWNSEKRSLLFAQNFKRLFLQYERYLDEQLRLTHMQLNRMNRIATLSELPEILNDIDALRLIIQEKFRQVSVTKENLTLLQKLFFQKLSRIGKMVGISLPEPNEIELVEVRNITLEPLLKEILTEQRVHLNQMHLKWEIFSIDMPLSNIQKLLRRTPQNTCLLWANLMV
ncbi:dynamin family protein [Acinetobacter brisouii]|uniref:dynamin family protein n=1 Tax=Acinetobacter brisouii TaxID=396323 RepID=UPI00124F5B1F|nr:dynamin family protein [Acinetobacter brisouii]